MHSCIFRSHELSSQSYIRYVCIYIYISIYTPQRVQQEYLRLIHKFCLALQKEYKKSVASLEGREVVTPGIPAMVKSIRGLILKSRRVHCIKLENYVLQNPDIWPHIQPSKRGQKQLTALIHTVTKPSPPRYTEHLCWLLAWTGAYR